MITVPFILLSKDTQRKSKYIFELENIKYSVLNKEDFINYNKENCSKKINFNLKKNPNVIIKSYREVFYKIIKGIESHPIARFLSKELLFREILLDQIAPINGIFSLVNFQRKNIDCSEEEFYVFMDLVINNKNSFQFDINKFEFLKYSNITLLQFYKQLIKNLPFHAEAHKEWFNLNKIYNLHSLLSVTKNY